MALQNQLADEHSSLPGRALARLAVDGLSVGYHSSPLLVDVSLSVRKRQTALIVGSNGSGKSTLLACIAGDLPPIAGRIFVDGVDVSRLTRARRRARGVVYMRQTNNVFLELSVRDNLRLCEGLTPRPRQHGGVDAVCSIFPSLSGRISSQAGTLSAGMKQQLALAMALVQRPRLLLLDEPFRGMAGDTSRYVAGLLRKIVSDEDVAVVIAENRFTDVLPAEGSIHLVANHTLRLLDEARSAVDPGACIRSAIKTGL